MDYDVKINGVTLDAEFIDLQTIDRYGAMADEMKIVIRNTETVNISRGDAVACFFGGYASGKMTVDLVASGTRTTRIGAISAPQCGKITRTRHWLKVRLFDIVNDIATNCGLSVFYKGVFNYFYENVTQFHETDLAFLNRLCEREGYSLKIDDNRLVIYSREVIEVAGTAATIGFDDVLKNNIAFTENPNKVSAVTVKYYSDRLIEYTATRGIDGDKKIITEYVADEAEAERFAKSYLALLAQNDITADALIPINDGIAAGNCVEFNGFGRFDGKYFVYECYHNPESDQTRIVGRKIQ